MKNIVMITLLAFGFGGCTNGQNVKDKGAHHVISIEEFAKRPANAQLVDVRTPGEWSEGVIAGALLIDIQKDDFKQNIAKLDKSKPVYVYCAVGGRSGKASKMMEEMGFKEVNDLKGGMDAWKVAKKPVVTK